MARPEVPIDPRTGPEAAFAVELRQLRELAGLTYRELAQLCHCSYGALCEAARGRRLPTWEVTKAFVKGCAGDEQQWKARWQAVAAEVKGSSGTATAPKDDGDEVAVPSDSSDVREHLPSGGVPPLSSITSLQDFHLALRELRTRAGNPSLRDLSVSARKRGDHVLPRSTLADALARTDRLPSLEIVEAFLSACDVQVTEVDAWKSAWTRVASLLQRRSMPGSIRWEDSCPYLGLAAFTEDQAEVFYGRECMITQLLAELAKRVRSGAGMLVVTGPSGAGKSSLLRAGLLPALAKGKLGPGSQDWPHLVITPGSAPLDELAVHLAQLAGVNSAEVRESLAENPDKAYLNARQALLACAAQHAGSEPKISPSRLVLVVDQFEELFTTVSDKAERAAFITSLCAMAGVGRGSAELPPAIVVLGLRADFFSDCIAYAPLSEAVKSSVFPVGPMTEIELRSAITGPAAAAGLSIEVGLVDNVLAELRSTRTTDGFDPGALPLLSQAMLLTWEHREGTTLTHHAYAAGGGLHNGIQKSAEAAYRNLTPAQQEAARRMFLRMVTFTNHDQPTRRRIQLNDLNFGSSTADDVRAALEEFANKRLITLDEDTAEIVHEVLVHIWKRLRSWIDQDREWLRLHRELESAASVWEENGRDPAFLYRESRLAAVQENLKETDFPIPPSMQSFLDSSRSHEKRRTRTLRGLSTLVGLLAIVALLAGGIALAQHRTRPALIGRELAANAQLQATEHPDSAMLLAVEAHRLVQDPLTLGTLLSAQSQYLAGRLAGHTGSVNKVVFSPEGNILATASVDGTARLWDVASHHEIIKFDSSGPVNDVEFSRDGRLLVTAGAKGTVQLWDVASRHVIPTLSGDPGTTFSAATFSPDGNTLATTDRNGAAWLWDVASHQEIAKLGGPSLLINEVVFSPDRHLLATTDADGRVQLWNVTDPRHSTLLGPPLPLTDRPQFTAGPPLPLPLTDRPQFTAGPPLPLTEDTDYVSTVVFSPDGNTLATASKDGTVKLRNVHDLHQFSVVTSWSDHGKPVNAMVFSSDGKTLATADADGTARLWNVENSANHKLICTLGGHDGAIKSVAFHPNRHTVATAGEDHIVRLWDTRGLILAPPTIGPSVNDIEFSPDGHALTIVGGDITARLWDIVNHNTIATLKDTSGAVAFSRNGRLLAIAGKGTDGTTTRLWDTVNHNTIATLKDPIDDTIDEMVFSPDNRILATTGANSSTSSQNSIVRLWNVADPSHPTLLHSLLTNSTRSTVAFSRDGRLLAIAGTDSTTAQLWDIANHNTIATLTGPTGFINKIIFKPDGSSLVTVGNDGTVRRWEAATGKSAADPQPIPLLPGEHSYPVALSPDGRILATTSSDDTTTKLWDMDHDNQPIAVLAGHTDHINTAAFSPDSHVLATASGDGTVRLWDLDAERVTTHLCRIIGTFSEKQWGKITKNQLPYRSTCP